MKQLVIGDVHGCYDELRELLDKVGLGDDDQIICIGDIVDRGPDNARALDFFRTTPNVGSIQGNHERKHVRVFRGESEPAASQVITRLQIGEADYAPAVAYMDGLPRCLDLPDAILVHAFWEPGVPLDQQREDVMVGMRTGEEYLQSEGFWPWYEYYDGPKPLIVGHRDYSGVQQPFVYGGDRVYAIDSRCVYGGELTGLLLPDFKLFSVPSRADHWTELQREYANLVTVYGDR
jgi:serine/threonine protein phosphatase 1